mmetsp:Transcript_30465/g.81958  ORF Transcript_30465/g.81958 Transcript_30465/m.81958 type:complete len:408 (+) Transcript_30465:61-1284(+)
MLSLVSLARGAAAMRSLQPSRVAQLARILPAVTHSRFFAAKTVLVPSMGDSISEGTVVEIAKKAGEYVASEEVVASVETDKVTVEVRAEESGTIDKWFCAEGDTVEVGGDLYSLNVGEGSPGDGAGAAPPPPVEDAAPQAPAAKTEAPPPPPPKAPPPPPAKPAAKPAASPSDGDSRDRRVPMTRMRMRIAERLKGAQDTCALLTTFNEVDMSALMAMRSKHKDAFEKKHGVKLGFMSAFVRAAVVALQEQPAVNAVIDGTDIVYRDYVDISVAVSSPKGLVVPVLRNCQDMSFADVEKEIGRLGKLAQTGGLALEDMVGGTFTITNGGVFGSLMSTPIVNLPQSAVLGMHGIQQRPMAVDGQVVIRPMMYIALTYDHRLIDGREAVTALKRIKELIEDPHRFLVEV